jgi:hypothetical protein
MELFDLNNSQKEKTIFVIGNSPQLNDVTPEQIKKIEEGVSIGVNHTPLKLKTTYYLAGHINHMLYHYFYTPWFNEHTIKVFHGPTYNFDMSIFENLVTTVAFPYRWYVRHYGGSHLPVQLTKGNSKDERLVGAENCALTASHLAFIMGAKNIVFVGMEMRSRAHFYNFDKKLEEAMLKGNEELLEKYKTTNKKVSLSFHHFLKTPKWSGMLPAEVISKITFPLNHVHNFGNYFRFFRSHGTRCISTIADSVMTEANAELLPLSEAVNL